MKKRILTKLLTIIAIILSTLFLMSACAKKDTASKTDFSNGSSTIQSADTAKVPKMSGSSSNEAVNMPTASTSQNNEQTVKKIIQTGEITIVADDLKTATKAIGDKADNLGGYVESENVNEYNSNSKVRIPSGKVAEFISYLENKFNVQSKNTSSQDITDAYVDNDARLKNMQVQEAQYQEIMKSTKTIDEILKVQGELFKVRGDIEALEAKKKNWDKDVDFSSINVSCSKEQLAIESKARILSGNEFVKAIAKGFTSSVIFIVLFLQKFMIYLLSNIIQLLFLVGAAVIGYKLYKKFWQ